MTTDSHLTRRTLLRYGAYGAGAAALAGTAASWDRLTGADLPAATTAPSSSPRSARLRPEAVRTLTEGFRKVHPGIRLRIDAVQAVDWSDFFAKILTQVAAGTAPDLVYVATEGCSSSRAVWGSRWTAGCGATRTSCASTSPTSTPRWWSR